MRNSMKKWNKSKYSLVMLLLAVMLATSGCTSIVKEGTELLEEGNYTEAAEKFQESVDKGKDLGEAWRGQSATGKKKITKRQKRRLEMHFKTVRRKQQPFIICWESVH